MASPVKLNGSASLPDLYNQIIYSNISYYYIYSNIQTGTLGVIEFTNKLGSTFDSEDQILASMCDV